jgi:hypothetical protein
LAARVDDLSRPLPEGELVSFESRQKKRRYKVAVKKAKKEQRGDTAGRWFLTFARADAKCSVCGRGLKRGGEIVYRHRPRAIRCGRCADRAPDSSGYRPSVRWERANRQRRLAA